MTVRFATIGTSWIARALIDAARTVPGVDVVAVSSRSEEGARAFAEANGVPRFHVGLDALAGDDAVDAVYVASPNARHAEQAITMLRAGKHVLVEKPLATTEAEAAAMADEARAAGRLLMEAYVAPFEPNVAAIRDALPELGQLRRAVLVKDQYSSKYDQLKAGGLPNAFDPRLAGGSLMDLAIYPVSLAVHLFGEPVSVLATGIVLGSGADGQGTIVLGYDGLEVLCLHSKITPAGIGSEISGEAGVLTFDDCSVPTRVVLHSRLDVGGQVTQPGFTRSHAGSRELTRPQSNDHMRYEVEEFAGLIDRGAIESAIHPPSRSQAALRILDEARRQIGLPVPRVD